ncbi:MAG TPA: response regulator transcription factor, partial [Saprospiraceae bacterium]|nr:response regulator transcription factor [Saprospiraceae bacterium]
YILKNTPPARIIEALQEIDEGGAPMSPSIASKVLKMVIHQPTPSNTSFNLSDREKEVLSCLVEGMGYKMIAEECYISVDTVRTHIRNIYEKLHVHSKAEAVAKAIKGKIV